MTEHGCWVYGITGPGPVPDLGDLRGVAGGAVRAVSAGTLTALVSDVDLDEFGAEALSRNLEDLDWLERVARAHHHVIETASRLLPVLPVGLTAVYTSEASMAEALRERRQEFAEALALVSGRVEWGVKAYPQPPSSERIVTDSPAPTDSGAGLAYLKRRRQQLNARQDSRREAAESAHAVHAALAGHAAGARLHPPQAPRLSGSDTPMVLNAAYLLDADDDAGFPAAVDAAAADHPELRLELTGPWPPYSFAGEAREGGT